MIDIPLKAEVLCTDGHSGTTTASIIDPVKRNVTHVVVESIKYIDYLVPLDQIAITTQSSIQLDCTYEPRFKFDISVDGAILG